MAEKEDLEREAQEKYMQVELLNKELEQISVQFDFINSKLNESITLRDSIENIQEGPSFSQLGAGIFISSQVTDKNSFLVNIGRRIFVKMNKEEIQKNLEKKIDNFKSVLSQVLKRKGLCGLVFESYFRDIGTPANCELLGEDIRSGNVDIETGDDRGKKRLNT